jgi:hypothetical protein
VRSAAWTRPCALQVLPSEPCLSVLIFYVSPFITAAAGLIAAGLAMTLARSFRHDESRGGGVSKGGRFFFLAIALAASALWVSASVAGASMGVSKVIMIGVAVLVLVTTVLIDRLFGWRAILGARPIDRTRELSGHVLALVLCSCRRVRLHQTLEQPRSSRRSRLRAGWFASSSRRIGRARAPSRSRRR